MVTMHYTFEQMARFVTTLIAIQTSLGLEGPPQHRTLFEASAKFAVASISNNGVKMPTIIMSAFSRSGYSSMASSRRTYGKLFYRFLEVVSVDWLFPVFCNVLSQERTSARQLQKNNRCFNSSRQSPSTIHLGICPPFLSDYSRFIGCDAQRTNKKL